MDDSGWPLLAQLVRDNMSVPFPDFSDPRWATSKPGPYECQMARHIAAILDGVGGRVPDKESSQVLKQLCVLHTQWRAGHAVFDELRTRLNRTSDRVSHWQYTFEEACAQALYNATEPDDPFDPSSPFFVTPAAASPACWASPPTKFLNCCSHPRKGFSERVLAQAHSSVEEHLEIF